MFVAARLPSTGGLRLALGLSCVLWLAACGAGGLHLYDKQKDETAQALKAAKEELDFTKTFATARMNLDELLKHELAVRADHIELRRKRVLRDVFYWDQSVARTVGQSFDTCSSPGDYDPPCPYMQDRMSALGIEDETALKLVVGASGLLGDNKLPDALKRAEEGIADSTREVSNNYGWRPKCADVEVFAIDIVSVKTDDIKKLAVDRGIAEKDRENFVAFVSSLTKNCFRRDQQLDKIEALKNVGGEIGSAYKNWIAVREELKILESACKDAKSALQDKDEAACRIAPAVPGADGAASGPSEEGASLAGKLQGDADRLAKNVKSAASSLEFLGLNRVLTESRVSALETLLGAFHSGNLDEDTTAALKKDPGLHRAAIIAAGLPGIGNEIEALAKILKAPVGRAGLAIQLAQQQLQLKYLKDRIAIEKNKVQLSAELLDAFVQEAKFLYNANEFAKEADDLRDKPWSHVFASPVDKNTVIKVRDNKRQAIRALISLDQSISVARQKQDALTYRLIDLDHRRAVLADEFAAGSWRILVDGPIDQIAAFHAAGIKPEEIARLVQGLGSLGLLGFVAVETD